MNRLFNFPQNDKSSFFSQLLRSYVLLLGIILIVNVPLLTYIGFRLSDENATTYTYITAEQQRYFDQCLNDMKSTAASVAYSAVPYNIIRNNVEADDYSDISQFRSLISVLTLRITQSFDMSFYVPEYSVVVSNYGIYPVNMYYTMNYSDTEGYSEWLSALCNPESDFFFFGTQGGANNIIYRCSPSDQSLNPFGAVFFAEMDAKSLTAKIRSHLTQTNFDFYITDKDGEILISTDENAPKTSLEELCRAEKYLHFSHASSLARWSYHLLLENTFLYSPIKQIKTLIFADIAFCIISALFYILYALKRHALPITDLLREIDVSGSTEDAVAIAKKKLSEMKRKNDRSDILMRQSFFDALLHGNVRETEHERFLGWFQGFTHERFVLVLLKPTENSLSVLFREGYEQNDISTIFINVFEELFAKNHRAAVIPVDDLYVCMLNSESPNASDMRDTINYAARILKTNFELEFYSCISDSAASFTKLSTLYPQALDMLGYVEFMQDTAVMTADDFKSGECGAVISSAVKDKIVQHLIGGESEQALALFDSVLDSMPQGSATSDFVTALKANTIVIATLVISSVGLDMTDNIEDLLSFTNTLTSSSSASALRSAVHSYFTRLCLLTSGSSMNKTGVSALLSDILAYIDENYSNPELCATMICNKFSIHPVYLSKLFKEPDGVGMLQYINNRRIEKAKQLLEDKELMMNDIMTQVGYANIRTFNRCFKAIVGTTPSAYRKQIQKNDKEK